MPTRAGAGPALRLGQDLAKRRACSGNIALIERRSTQDDEGVGPEEIPVGVIRAFGCFEALECTGTRAVQLSLDSKDFRNIGGRSGGWKSHRCAFQILRAGKAVVGFQELLQRKVGGAERQPSHADLAV